MRVALIAGVQSYQDPEITDLRFSDADVRKLSGFLEYKIGFDIVKSIPQANHTEVLDTAKRMVSDLSSEDLFLFYFAGHGYEYQGRHLLLCQDVRLSRIDYYQGTIPVDLLKAETNRPDISRLIILDACRSEPRRDRGNSLGLQNESSLRDIANSKLSKGGSLTVLCSCSEGQSAAEISSREQGLFTASLIDVLGDRYSCGVEATVNDVLINDLSEQMRILAQEAGIPGGQTPWRAGSGSPPCILKGKLKKRNDRTLQELPKTSSLEFISTPKLLIRSEPSGAGIHIEDNKRGITPLDVELSTGTYTVKAEMDGYITWERRLHFSAGGSDVRLDIDLEQKSSKLKKESFMYARFLRDRSSKIIEDKMTGLDWLIGPDKDTTHYEAQTWVDGLSGDWRLPTIAELEELYSSGIGDEELDDKKSEKSWGPFKNSGWFVWSDEVNPEDSSLARFFGFCAGGEFWYDRDDSGNCGRVFVVRSRG